MTQLFAHVKNGMRKDQVLSQVGSPRYSTHYDGRDHWYYIYFDHNVRTKKEIDFQNDAVVYAGDIPKPKISARKQDEINAKDDSKEKEEVREAIRETNPSYRKYQKQVEKTHRKHDFQNIP